MCFFTRKKFNYYHLNYHTYLQQFNFNHIYYSIKINVHNEETDINYHSIPNKIDMFHFIICLKKMWL